jgi:hypothetical protein
LIGVERIDSVAHLWLECFSIGVLKISVINEMILFWRSEKDNPFRRAANDHAMPGIEEADQKGDDER